MENGTNTPQDLKAPSPVNAGAYEDQPLGNPPLQETKVDTPIENIQIKALSLRLHQLEQKDILRDHQNASRLKNEKAISEFCETVIDKLAPIPEMQGQLDQIFAVTVTSTIYTFVDRNDEYIKIGWSENFESKRKKIHQKNNLEFVASCSGVKARETQLKNTFKAIGIKSRRGTQEEFCLNKKNIELMMGLGWPLGEDPYSLLKPNQYTLGIQ